jgi:transcriptional/translational regulatory protein YebC/TACO1
MTKAGVKPVSGHKKWATFVTKMCKSAQRMRKKCAKSAQNIFYKLNEIN